MTALEYIQIAGVAVAAVASIAALIQSISNHFAARRGRQSLGDAIQRVHIDINSRLSQFLEEREAKGFLAGTMDARQSGAAAQLAEELLASARLVAAEVLRVAREQASERLEEAGRTAVNDAMKKGFPDDAV
jgi:hypothetical protein